MSEHSWWWQNDAGGWEQFNEFNSASLEQAFSDDRQITRLDFPGGAEHARGRWVLCCVFQRLDAGLAALVSTHALAGFARGSVVANLGDMTMGDTVTPDTQRRQIRRQTTTGDACVPVAAQTRASS